MSCILDGPMYQRYSRMYSAVGDHHLTSVILRKAELKQKLASMYEIRDEQCIFVFGFRTQVGSVGLSQLSRCVVTCEAARSSVVASPLASA